MKSRVTPKDGDRPELTEKATCPECGKELTVHGLKYTHKRYCKANKPDVSGTAPVVQPVLEKLAPMPNLDTSVATDEQISAYLLKQKKMRASITR